MMNIINPAAQELAERYNLNVDDVQGWFDQNFTRAQIDRACRMGDEYDCEPSDILAMLAVGFDWRQIEKALDTIPDDDGDDDGY